MTPPPAARRPQRKLLAPVAAGLLCLASQQCLAADDEGPKGAAVTVLQAAKSCFSAIVEVSGFVMPREQTVSDIRPEKQGAKVTEVLAEPGDTVTAGQTLARLSLPGDGGTQNVQAPIAGQISASSAVIGAMAQGKDALFSIIPTKFDFDLIGLVPTADIAKLAVNQLARIKIIGAGDIDGRVRRIGPTVEPNTQQGQVFVALSTTRRLLVNSAGRALIKTGQSCGVSVPLTAILYGSGGAVVQVVRRQRIETKRVEVGLMSGGQVEIRGGLLEGDIVVARAGSLLREGDPVRPVTAAADPK
jgi:HlyD family secretion protein